MDGVSSKFYLSTEFDCLALLTPVICFTDCQGEGEFVLSKATLTNYDYDFELHSRFTMFGQNLPWTFNSGMVAKQDVAVQISMGEIGVSVPNTKPNMFDNVPIYFYVDGVPRYFNEGAGDPRVKVYVDGFHIFVTFVSTGIQVHVQVRPFFSDPHGGIMNNRDGEIPGSFTTYLCLPADNDAITNVMGLLGTPSYNFADDFMKNDGTPISKPSDLTNYCKTEWCIKNSAETLFTFESGKDFATYNKCGSTRRHLEVTEADVTPEVLAICDKVEGHQFCLEEGHANGEKGAMDAVTSMLDGENAILASESGERQDDDACCSVDHKTCLEGCDIKNKYFCDLCNADAVWLSKGTYELEQGKFAGCLAKDAARAAADDCCPGLVCGDAGTCVKKPEEARRLGEFKLERPDIPAVRNVIPYHSEL